MNPVRKLFVVIALAGMMGSAQAAPFELGTLGSTTQQNTQIFPTSEPLAFEDIYNFTIGDLHTLLASAVGHTPEGTTPEEAHVSNLSLSLFASADGSSLGSVSSASGTQVDLSQNLVSGNYFLKVSGIADGSLGGAYQFSIAAVPEPAEWMLLVSGLLLMAFIARRKTSLVAD